MTHEEDAAIIRAAQERYRAGDGKALEDIYSACRRIARRMIERQMRTRGFALSEPQAEEKAHDAAVYAAMRYVTKRDFSMKSPASYIYPCVLCALYRRSKMEKAIAEALPALQGMEFLAMFQEGDDG